MGSALGRERTERRVAEAALGEAEERRIADLRAQAPRPLSKFYTRPVFIAHPQ